MGRRREDDQRNVSVSSQRGFISLRLSSPRLCPVRLVEERSNLPDLVALRSFGLACEELIPASGSMRSPGLACVNMPIITPCPDRSCSREPGALPFAVPANKALTLSCPGFE